MRSRTGTSELYGGRSELFEDELPVDHHRGSLPSRGFSVLTKHTNSGLFYFPSTGTVDFTGWSETRLLVKRTMDSKRFDVVMGAIILGNLVLIVQETNANAVCETSEDPLCDVPLVVKILNPILLAIYTVELLARFFAYRGWFFRSVWNVLDLLVVSSGLCDFVVSSLGDSSNVPNLTAVRVFRLVRLARTVRLLAAFPELYDMMRGFGGAMKAMFWGFTIIVLMLGLWSLLAVEFVHPVNKDVEHEEEWCEDAFSSVQKATLFFFQTLVAGDSWGACTIPIIQKNVATVLIFALALVSVQLGFTNLILAVIVEAAHQAKEKDSESRLREKKKYEKDCVDLWRSVIEGLDEDKSGTISIAELKKGYREQPEVSKILGLLDVDWQDLETLFRLMDTDNSGEVSYVEFFHCLRRAHTQDMRMYLMNVKLQISHLTSLIIKQHSMMFERCRVPTAHPFASEATHSTSVTADFDKAKNIHGSRPSFWRRKSKLAAIDISSLNLGVGQPKVVVAGREDNSVPHSAPAPIDKEPKFEPKSVPKSAAKSPKRLVRAASAGSASEMRQVEPSLAASCLASLDKLRTELEQRLDETAAAAVALVQNTKSLEALVVSCASDGTPAALDSVGNSMPTSRTIYSRGKSQREHRGLVQAVMGQMIPSGGSHLSPPAVPPRSASFTSSSRSVSTGSHS